MSAVGPGGLTSGSTTSEAAETTNGPTITLCGRWEERRWPPDGPGSTCSDLGPTPGRGGASPPSGADPGVNCTLRTVSQAPAESGGPNTQLGSRWSGLGSWTAMASISPGIDIRCRNPGLPLRAGADRKQVDRNGDKELAVLAAPVQPPRPVTFIPGDRAELPVPRAGVAGRQGHLLHRASVPWPDDLSGGYGRAR